MEANLRGSNLGHDLLEMIVDRVRIQILAKLMGEHKVHRILKALTVLKLPGLLLPFDAITSTFFSPATSSFSIGGTCKVFRYSFDKNGQLILSTDTGDTVPYRR